MPDLLNYLDNYNRPITADLNVADQMILTRLPFLPLQDIVAGNLDDEIALPQALKQLETQLANTSEHLLLPNDRILIQKLQTSFRYEKVSLSNFKIQSPENLDNQCAAITVRVAPHTKIIVFRGADGTTLGWQSDLQVLYEPNGERWQSFARNYLEKTMHANSDNFQIIGYSKGGSMAIYVASQIDAKNRIKQVINFDGPKVTSTDDLPETFKTRFQTYLPQLPFFGIGSAFTNAPKIVTSMATGIWQHDLYSWHLHDADPVILGQLQTTDDFLNHQLCPWIHKQTRANAQQFINTFWEILDDTQAVSVNDLLKHWQQVTKAYRKQSSTWDPVAQQMGKNTLQSAFQIIVSFTPF
ncbi:Mbeg1-like protein [Pediococcus parvulus]|uniref:Mbeg1-like protein n=1 Tax=Pediococcus parvulus TaxID=54062 RepID=UPI00345E7A04